MLVVNEKTITSYGKSMYGGWYANYRTSNDINGIRCDTLKELCSKLKVSKTALRNDVERFDN